MVLRILGVVLKVALILLAFETITLQPGQAKPPKPWLTGSAVWRYMPVCQVSWRDEQRRPQTAFCDVPSPPYPLLYPGDPCYASIDGVIWLNGVGQWVPRFDWRYIVLYCRLPRGP
jgi:hypothetical protein